MRFITKIKSRPPLATRSDGDRAEERFRTVLNLVKDLDRKEFNTLKDALSLAWEGYDKIRKVQTREEKEASEIVQAEKVLDFVEGEK